MACAIALGNGQWGFMRGYRDPHPDDESENVFRFEDQFEWDDHGLTFRRFGRGRPVRVTPDERDQCIERFERIDAHMKRAGIAVFIAWLAGAMWLGTADTWTDVFWMAGLIAVAVATRGAEHRLWTKMTSHFARRAPVGPERTMMDQYRSKAAQLSWPAVGLSLVVGTIALWLADRHDPWRLFESAQIGLALAGVLALTVLKVFDRRR